MMKHVLLSVLLAGAMLPGGPARAADLTINITGIGNGNGTIIACLWSSGWGFPDCEGQRDNVTIARAQAQPGTVTFAFTNVKPGKYAVSVAHDQNNDGKLERHRFLKYPLEGAGVSNYQQPPRFMPLHHEAVFEVAEPAATVNVPMHYPPQ